MQDVIVNPAAAITTFAPGINRMRAHYVLIGKLEAVEILGAVQVACLDKTGTITKNHMTVQAIHVGHRTISVVTDEFVLDDRTIDPADIEELKRASSHRSELQRTQSRQCKPEQMIIRRSSWNDEVDRVIWEPLSLFQRRQAH